MFPATFLPIIIKSTWLYLQHLVVFTQVAAAGVMEELKLRFNPSMTPVGSDLSEYYQML